LPTDSWKSLAKLLARSIARATRMENTRLRHSHFA
jgi:hypothetical protein